MFFPILRGARAGCAPLPLDPPLQCFDWRMLKYLVFPLFVFSEIRWQMIVCFVDIGGIVDHLCLDFLFIIEIVFRTEINFHHTHIFWICNKYIFIGLNIKIKKEILFLSAHTAVFCCCWNYLYQAADLLYLRY